MTRQSLGKVRVQVCLAPRLKDYLLDEARVRHMDVSQIISDYVLKDIGEFGIAEDTEEGGHVYRYRGPVVFGESVDGADGVGSRVADDGGAEGRGGLAGGTRRQARPSARECEGKARARGRARRRTMEQAEAEARVRESLGPDWEYHWLKKNPHGRGDGATK